MRNLKKILALVLALMMVLSVMVTASAASFDDDADIDYKEAVEVLAAAGILNGDGTGNFLPDEVLNRASAAVLLTYVKMGKDISLIEKTATEYKDVPASHWASGFVNYCSEQGIIAGDGMGSYYPDVELNGYAFAKMLLVAAYGYTNEDFTAAGSWTLGVALALKANPSLTAGLKLTLSEGITREEAAQMVFNAMNYSVTGSTVTGYAVEVAGKTVYFDSYLDAYVYVSTIDSLDADDIQTLTNASDSLMAINYPELTNLAGTRDAFGRVYASKWTYTDEEGNVSVVYAETVEADLKLTMNAYIDYPSAYGGANESLKAYLELMEIVEDAEDVVYATGSTRYVDGKPESTTTNMLNAGDTVEIYMNDDGEITNVVVIKNYTSTVETVNEADEETETPANIILADLTTAPVVTDAYAEDDVVLYNKAYVAKTGKYAVVNLTKAESVTGTLTAYTSRNVFTIAGNTYTVSNVNGTSATASAIKGYYGEDKVYYLDANNCIVKVTGLPGTEEETPVSTDYAMVLAWDSSITVKGGGTWLGSTSEYYVSSITAQVKVLLDDGSVVACDLPIVEGSEDDKNGITEGYYTIVDGKAVVLYTNSDEAENASAATAAAKNAMKEALGACFTEAVMANTVYSYVAEDGAISLTKVAALTGEETESGDYVRKLGSSFNKTSTTISLSNVSADVLVNEETVFILTDTVDDKPTIVVKTGISALEYTTVNAATNVRVVVGVTVSEDEDVANVNVAKVVFAQNDEFDATPAEDAEIAEDIVFVTGDYVTTKNEDGEYVYTYTAINVVGDIFTLTGNAGLTAGLYEYDEEGVLAAAPIETSGAGTVGVIAGTTYQFVAVVEEQTYTNYYTVNSDTVVTDLTGEGLTSGAGVIYVLDGTVVTNIFVIEAAE